MTLKKDEVEKLTCSEDKQIMNEVQVRFIYATPNVILSKDAKLPCIPHVGEEVVLEFKGQFKFYVVYKVTYYIDESFAEKALKLINKEIYSQIICHIEEWTFESKWKKRIRKILDILKI